MRPAQLHRRLAALCAIATCFLGLGVAAPAAAVAAETSLTATRGAALKPLVRERLGWRRAFEAAYARYPALPRGSLEAIAFVQTGWNHVVPDPLRVAEPGVPAAYGIMGLYHGGGFDDQVREGAALAGLDEKTVLRDPAANILAAAALLDHAFAEAGEAAGRGSAEVLARALERYAGFGDGSGEIASWARASFAWDVLGALERGVTENGVRVPRLALDREAAFTPLELRLLKAPVVNLDAASGSLVIEGWAPPLLGGVGSPPPQPLASDYPGAIWNPANPANYSTAWNSDEAVIIHTMEGSYASAIAWFQNPSAQVSAHYCVRRSDGQVTQMVAERHQAWHAAYHNYYTVGIEHEGYAGAADNWTAAIVNASAGITRSACERRGIDCSKAWEGPGYDYWYVVPDWVTVKGHGMLTQNSNRYDPGKYFPWADYYQLINGGGPIVVDPYYWVDTWANAPGFDSPTSTNQTGTLYAGTNYTYCKTWGREIANGGDYNHWWLKTDLDVGPAGQWVSAFYLNWGNDEARTNDGYDLPRCEVLPYGAIAAKWYAMGGIRSILGVPELEEMDAQLGGRFQQFAQGIILWHADAGAWAIHGRILDHFRATGAEGVWGFPSMDEMDAAPSPASGQVGRYQYFDHGLFLWTPATDAHVVHGAILAHFEENGREPTLGYPTEDEAPGAASPATSETGRRQGFEKGLYLWTPATGAHFVKGRIGEHFAATGSEAHHGYPTMDEAPAAPSPASGQVGRYQYFEASLFLWTPATDAHAIEAPILAHFETTGREAHYGYPLGDRVVLGDGWCQAFEKYEICWSQSGGYEVRERDEHIFGNGFES